MKRLILLGLLATVASSAYGQQGGGELSPLLDLMQDEEKRSFYEKEIMPILKRQYTISIRRVKQMMAGLPEDMDGILADSPAATPEMTPSPEELALQKDLRKTCHRSNQILGKALTEQILQCK